MTAKVIPIPVRHRSPREQLEAEEIIGVQVFRSGQKWGLRRYEPGRIVEIHGLEREDLANLADTISRALESIPL